MSHDPTHAALKNLLHRAGWVLSLVPQAVSAAEYAERTAWTGDGAEVHRGVNGYEDLAASLVREINAAVGLSLTMTSGLEDDGHAAIRRLAAARSNPPPRRPLGAPRRAPRRSARGRR